MNRGAFVLAKPARGFMPQSARSMLQRKCACGVHTPGGGACRSCASQRHDRLEQVSWTSPGVPLIQRQATNKKKKGTTKAKTPAPKVAKALTGVVAQGSPLSATETKRVIKAGETAGINSHRYIAYKNTIRVGGAAAWRANNPGSLRSDNAAIASIPGIGGKVAVFPDLATGLAAQKSLYLRKFGKMTVRDAMKELTPEFENDLKKYLKDLEAAGVALDTDVESQIDILMPAVRKLEGETAGVEVLRDAEVEPDPADELPQKKSLSIGASDDPLEKAADLMAERVMAGWGKPGNSGTSPQLQRWAPGSVARSDDVPDSVHQTLRGSGDPLGAGLRGEMEGAFGYDFSQVRVHQGNAAGRSAREVDALAYTVGSNIVFGTGRFAPGTADGRRLLAHELTHVVQQGASSPAAGNRTLFRQKDETVDVGLEPIPRAERRDSLPQVSLETWQQLTSHADRKLEPAEQKLISSITKTAAPATPLAFVQGPRFVLHDPEGSMKPPEIRRRTGLAKGPLGEEGSAAYVPETGPADKSYAMFEPRRVASTQFERGADIMKQSGREAGYRAIWKEASASERAKALDAALAGLNLSEAEAKAEKASATAQLNAAKGDVRTTGSWVAAEICKAVPLKACETMKDLLTKRKDRISSTVNVEINMPKEGEKVKGKPGPLPSYTENQYTNVRDLYLKSALLAGKFPTITTHWLLDRGIEGGHHDPRCFDLHHLYALTAQALGHQPASEYGITPEYGTKAPANVWWDPVKCGRKAP